MTFAIQSNDRRTGHMVTSHLWIEEVAAKMAVSFNYTTGTENAADLMTKELPSADFNKYVDIFWGCIPAWSSRIRGRGGN